MTVQLTQKERQLLQDQKGHEEVCIEKYQNNAQKAGDPQLKQLFQNYAQQERQHLNTIASILSGQVPAMNQGQGQQAQQSQASQENNDQFQAAPSAAGKADALLCNDMLMTEKYVSSAYNTAIFEFTDPSIRQALNHIQKEEQQHGEGIFNYLNSKGLYNVQ